MDVASAWGFFGGQPTWAAQTIDMDADGDLDVFNAHHFYSGFIFTNNGPGQFSIFGLTQIIQSVKDRHGYLWVDLDGDSGIDIICSHGGEGGCGCSDDGNELWRTLSPGVFGLVDGAGGMADLGGRGRSFSGADIDGDGDLDVHHSKAPLAGNPNSLYRNDGGLTFVDVASQWGVDEELGSVGALFADYDDDGDPDLLVAGEEFARPTKLFRNDGDVFTDVTASALGAPPILAGADWGDFDNDGDLDLVTVEGDEGVYDAWKIEGLQYWLFANHRFGDDGVDVFTFETPGEDPVAQFRWDGSFIQNRFFLGPNAIPVTTASVQLTDAYVGAPTFTPGVSYGLYCWRESPGGPWQVHVSAAPGTFGNFAARIATVGGVAATGDSNLEQLTVEPAAPVVYRNDGGTFVSLEGLGFTESANPRAVQWVDFDNDGDLDVHLLNRGTVETGNEPDVLWRNDGGSFTPLTGPDGVPGLAKAFTDGGCWADLDQDGDQDLVLQEGIGPFFFTAGVPGLIYRNDGPTGRWLMCTLDRVNGKTAVGTRVTVSAGDVHVRQRLEANTWRGFQGPNRLHFGLGEAAVVDSVVVEWPQGGREVFGPYHSNVVLGIGESGEPVVVGENGPSREIAFVGAVQPQPGRGLQLVHVAHRDGITYSIRVFDVTGRRVRALTPEFFSSGSTISWDGRDERGQRVPAGVYFLRAQGDVQFVRKSVRLR